MHVGRTMLLGGVLSLSLAALPFPALAEGTGTETTTTTQATTEIQQVDAGDLIGKNVKNEAGESIGEIDSVMIDNAGQVKSVILDVSDWLESEKLITVAWTDLKMTPEGDVTSALTKEEADAAAAYTYSDETYRGKVLTEAGEPYRGAGAEQQEAAQTDDTGGTTVGDALDLGTPVINADGSFNASQLMGLDVQNAAKESIGDIGEVVLGEDGRVNGVVVDVGGFLGVGAKPVLVEWDDVTVTEHEDQTVAMIDASKEQLKQLPEYKQSDAQ